MNTVHGPYGPQDFPRLAKEMGFCFTLRRGRVDWYRIDSIDVDRLVQERDLVALQENLLSIVNYNLDSEFDVKILDTNFVKLFRLAQLAIDYLMYSEQYLYNCIQAEHEEKNKLTKDLEKLKKESKKKDSEIKNLKRRHNRLQLDANHLHKHALGAGGEVPNYCKCLHCGKLFLTPGYLEAHHGRRHPGLTFAVNHSRTESPDVLRTETERLQSEIKELKERLNNTERLIHTAESSPVFQDHGTFAPQSDIQTESAGEIDEAKKEMEELQKAQHQKYLEEISALKTMFTNELKRLRQQNQQESPSKNNLQEQVQKQEQEILLLREKLSMQSTPDLDSMQSKMDAQERLWKSKLKQVELEYRNEVEQLKAQLQEAKESYKKTVPVIEKPEPVKVSVGTNTESIEVAVPLKPAPVTAITEEPESQAQKGNIVNIGDSSITLAELTARIESAIRASQGGATDAGKEKEKKESPQIFRIPKERLTVETLSEKPPVRLKKSLSDPSTQGKPVKMRKNSQPVKSSVSKSLFPNAQLPKSVIKLTSESSDESLRTEQQGTGSSADEPKQVVQAGSVSKVVNAWSSAQSLEKEPDSLVASKDSGLDSPKRIPSGKVTKIESSEKGSLKTASTLKESKVVHRHEKSETEDEEEGEEEEEEESEEVEEEEEETEEDEEEEEEDEDETPTDHETIDAIAARNIESIEDTLKQNPQILDVLKEDLQELLARRLRELGIDPEWKGIPAATFQQKKAILRHHQKITAKGCKSYFKIRKKLLRDLQTKLREKEEGAQDSTKRLKQEKKSRWNSSQQRKTVRNLVGKVKSKALSVLKGSRSSEALQSKSGSSSKLGTRIPKSSRGVLPKSSSTPSKTLSSQIGTGSLNLEKRRKHIHVAKKTDGKPVQVFSKPRMAEPKMRMYPSSQQTAITASKAKVATSTPNKGKSTIFAKGRDRASEEIHATSVSSLDEEEEEEAEGTNKDQYSSDESGKDVAGSSTDDLHLAQDLENKNNPLTKTNLQVTALRTQEVPSSQLTPPLKSRSALKTTSSASLGSLTKKRVLFVGQDNGSSDGEHSDLQESKTTLATARHTKSIDSIVPRPTTSWGSNASAAPTKPLKSTSEPSVSQKSHVQSDSDSEWSIGIDNIKRSLDAPSNERIQLSTKQSPLIAQLSKDIQKQLSARSGPPPAGSVETMLTAGSLLYGSSEQSLFSDIENDMNLGNKHSSNNTTPKTKPRSNVPSSPSKLSTSDWDLEDFDD